MAELLDMNAIAKRLGCSKAHVSNLINGKVKGTTLLPSVRVGRCRRVIASTFEAWLKENEDHEGSNDQKATTSEGISKKVTQP